MYKCIVELDIRLAIEELTDYTLRTATNLPFIPAPGMRLRHLAGEKLYPGFEIASVVWDCSYNFFVVKLKDHYTNHTKAECGKQFPGWKWEKT